VSGQDEPARVVGRPALVAAPRGEEHVVGARRRPHQRRCAGPVGQAHERLAVDGRGREAGGEVGGIVGQRLGEV